MKDYEVIREIPNSCGNNQMRDIAFREVSCDSPADYVRSQFPEKEIEINEDVKGSGERIVYATVGNVIHKYIFTEI